MKPFNFIRQKVHCLVPKHPYSSFRGLLVCTLLPPPPLPLEIPFEFVNFLAPSPWGMSNDSLLGEYGYFLESHCSRCRVYCRRQEETAILISTHALHVCTQHSFGLPLRMNGCSESNLILHVWTFYHSLYDDACFDHLSLETYTKHSIRVKAFWLLIVSPALCNLWLLLVCVPVFLSFSTQETYFVAFLVVPYFTLYVFSHFFFLSI